MDSPDFASCLLMALYATCRIFMLVLSDNDDTHMFLLSIYIAIVVGEIFYSVWAH
jgi:hypothetical protein